MAGVGAEIGMVVAGISLYVAYHIWLFYLRGTSLRTPDVHESWGLFNLGKIARVQFSNSIVHENDTICGIQQNRNCLLAVSFIAGICSLLAQKVMSILLDADQQAQIRKYAKQDPVTQGSYIAPAVVLGFNFVLLMASILSFAQAVRLYAHSGYFFKAAALPTQSFVTPADSAEVCIQAQVAQTLGMRLLFFFPVSALWLIGPTAMIITSVITTAGVAFLDFWKYDISRHRHILQELDERSDLL